MICLFFFHEIQFHNPEVQACFFGFNQAPRITSVRTNNHAKLLKGPLQKCIFGVTSKVFHATSHCNTIFLRVVSVTYSDSGLVYGENEAGFRLLNFTRTGGWASVTPARGRVSG